MPKAAIFKSLVARRFIMALVMFSSLVTLVTTGVQLGADYRRDLTDIEEHMGLIQAGNLEAVTQSLWTFDDQQLGIQLDGMLAIPEIEFAEIKREGGVSLSRGARRSKNKISQTFPIVYRDRASDIKLGQLEIVASLDSVYQRLFDKVLIVLASNGVKTFLVAGFLYLIFYHLVSRHLSQIAEFIRTLDLRKPQVQLQLDKKGRRDEFDNIADTLNEMSSNLRKNEERYAFAMSGTNDGVWDWNIETDAVHLSPRWHEILGYEEDELVQRMDTFRSLLHPHDRDTFVRAVRSHLEARTPFEEEFRLLYKNSGYRWVLAKGQAVWDARGDAVRMAGSISDITERKKAEDEVRQLNAELEYRVAARTKELRAVQGELVKKERLATLGQLSASVSHELRNPLGAISLSLTVVEARAKAEGHDPNVTEAIERMKRGVRRCDLIIEEMLDFARDRDLQIASTDLDVWLKELLDEQALPDGVALHYRPNSDGVKVSLDPELFRRAVINLYNNACDAMLAQDGKSRDGRAHRLVVETRCVKGSAEISIIDNGTGMPPEVLGNSFEPLYSTKSYGVGLGLPIVKKIVEQHNGSLKIASEPDAGTRVTLIVPLLRFDAEAGEISQAS